MSGEDAKETGVPSAVLGDAGDGSEELDESFDETAPDSRDDAMASLLKRSLATPGAFGGSSGEGATGESPEMAPAPVVEKILLKNVQRKIRKRSRGRFFADGWSTSASRVSYVTIAMLMLFVLAVAFFALAPSAIQ